MKLCNNNTSTLQVYHNDLGSFIFFYAMQLYDNVTHNVFLKIFIDLEQCLVSDTLKALSSLGYTVTQKSIIKSHSQENIFKHFGFDAGHLITSFQDQNVFWDPSVFVFYPDTHFFFPFLIVGHRMPLLSTENNNT